MDEYPLISVLIPTRNEEKYLPFLLKSIKAQTYKNYEIIIGDYMSVDNTILIARKYGAKVIKCHKKGMAAGKNAALNIAKGEIISFVDADFILSKRLFESVVKMFRKEKDVVGIEPRSALNPRSIRKDRLPYFRMAVRIINILKRFSYHTKAPFAFGCVFCRASAVKRAGRFKEHLLIIEDKDFYSRLRKYGRFKMVNATAMISFRRQVGKGFLRSTITYIKAEIGWATTGKVKGELEPVRL